MSESLYDNWRELAVDLQLQLRDLTEQLTESRRLYNQEKFHVAVLRQEQREMGALVVPLGDNEHGYECPRCCRHIDYAFEDDFCAGCGAKFDWWLQDPYCDSAIQAAENDVDYLREKAAGLCS